MPAHEASSRLAVVTGDLTIDWNLARTRRDPADAEAWNADDSTRAYWQRGGAALLADVVAAVAGDLEEAGSGPWDVRRIAAPTDPVCPEDLPYHHSYAIWSNRGGSKDAPAWRVEEFLGPDPRSGHPGSETADSHKSGATRPTLRSSCSTMRRWDFASSRISGPPP